MAFRIEMQTVHEVPHLLGHILVQQGEKTACSRDNQHTLNRLENCDGAQSCPRRASANQIRPLPSHPALIVHSYVDMSDHAPAAHPQLPPEPRWPAVLGVLAVGGLLLSLPEPLTLGPTRLLPSLVLALLSATVVCHSIGAQTAHTVLGYVVSGVITAGLAWSLASLVSALPNHRVPAASLLRSAGALWLSNILIFASWYWRLDAGGPQKRDQRTRHAEGAFLFPQMLDSYAASRNPWKPGFVDYLFLAFNTSTAFSPTDAAPLTRWAKLLMMLQSVLSLSTLVIVAARAVNIL
jgi:hypothetical protein